MNDLSQRIFADLVSKDFYKIRGACWEIVKLDDEETILCLAEKLDDICQMTNYVELGGIFYSNRETLDFVLKKIGAL